jgi:hypothetical protein
MALIDLRRFALRLKVLEMVGIYAQRRAQEESGSSWRRLILPN